MEDVNDLTQKIKSEFDNKLQETLRNVIQTYEIPRILDVGIRESYCLSIYVVKEEYNKGKRKSKKDDATVKISYSFNKSFCIEDVIKSDDIRDINLIFEILKPEIVASITNKIKFWSRGLFKAVNSYIKDYNFSLCVFPFQIYFDENDKIYISRLPNFSDLRFTELGKSEILTSREIVEKHTEVIQGIASFLTD